MANIRKAAQKVVDKAAEMLEKPIPGAPGPTPPPLEEPTDPTGPPPPKADQDGPETRTPTGAPTGAPKTAVAQQGDFLTTAQGARLSDTDHSLKAGERGPTLLQDHHLREKITHFDHERIPERVVHPRGAGVHGVFVGNGTAGSVSKAGFLAEGKETAVFVRFSTVLGSRGSADTVRDTRRHHPCRQAAPRPGDPAGAERARHVSVRTVRSAVLAAGMVPLLVGPMASSRTACRCSAPSSPPARSRRPSGTPR